jgi:hypothetical protein
MIKKTKNLNEIPENERWLYKNKEALAAVTKGLAQAAKGEFGKDPRKKLTKL